MVRVLVILALLIAAASAFVTPANHAVSTPAFTRVQAPKMALESIDLSAVSELVTNANLIATSVNDNAGYAFPVVGLALLAGTILYLAPPLVDE